MYKLHKHELSLLKCSLMMKSKSKGTKKKRKNGYPNEIFETKSISQRQKEAKICLLNFHGKRSKRKHSERVINFDTLSFNTHLRQSFLSSFYLKIISSK